MFRDFIKIKCFKCGKNLPYKRYNYTYEILVYQKDNLINKNIFAKRYCIECIPEEIKDFLAIDKL